MIYRVYARRDRRHGAFRSMRLGGHPEPVRVAAEGATLEFTAEGIAEVARVAFMANDRLENIGARRLHTVMAALMEDMLFELPEYPDKSIRFDAPGVRERLAKNR